MSYIKFELSEKHLINLVWPYFNTVSLRGYASPFTNHIPMHYMSTDDQVFGAVKGGAVLAALSDFPFAKKFDVSVVEEKIKRTTPFNFYYYALGYSPDFRWGLQMNATKLTMKKIRMYPYLEANSSSGERFYISDSSDEEQQYSESSSSDSD